MSDQASLGMRLAGSGTVAAVDDTPDLAVLDAELATNDPHGHLPWLVTAHRQPVRATDRHTGPQRVEPVAVLPAEHPLSDLATMLPALWAACFGRPTAPVSPTPPALAFATTTDPITGEELVSDHQLRCGPDDAHLIARRAHVDTTGDNLVWTDVF